MLKPEEKIEELKANYKRFTGLELFDEDILYVSKIIRAEKAAKFIRDNCPLYPQIVDIISFLEDAKTEGITEGTKAKNKGKK